MKIKGIYHMPGSRFYWFRWTEAGKRYAVSLKTDALPEAIKKAEDILAGRAAAEWNQHHNEPITMATKVVDDYLVKAQSRSKKPMRPRTVHRRGKILKKFLRDSGIKSVQEINRTVMEKWLAGLKNQGRSAETLHSYTWALKIFTKYLQSQGTLRGDLNLEVPDKPTYGRKSWVRMEEADRVIDQAKDDTLRFILFAGFHAGMRKSEIIAAKVGWFDLQAGLIHIQNDPAAGFILKDRDNRTLPIVSKKFREFLTGFLAGRKAGEYCIEPDKKNGKNEYRYDFKNSFISHMKRCGVKCTTHDMRRSFASNLVSRGTSLYKVAKWIGDGYEVVERSYGHLAPSDKDSGLLD